MIGVRRPRAFSARGTHGTWIAALAVALVVGAAGLLGGAWPIPDVAVGETLDPAQTQAARRAVEASALGIETIRGDVDRALRAADVQQIIGPATVCQASVSAECATQLRAVAAALGAWQELLARQPAHERALGDYDNALMAQTRALGGAGEPLREATWPVVGAADQLGLIRTKYAAFYDPAELTATQAGLDRCAGLTAGSTLPVDCPIAVAAALKTGQVVEARATVDDQYRRALDRYQRALDERIAAISDEPRTSRLIVLIDAATVAGVAIGGALLAWRGAGARRRVVDGA